MARQPGRLTLTDIDRAKPIPGEQFVLWDRSLPGFGVRVSPRNTKTYIAKYRLPGGRVRWLTLGRTTVLTLDEARKRARSALGIVADGKDPQLQKDAAKAALTLGEVADLWLEHVDETRAPATARNYRSAIELHVRPQLGPRAIGEVGLADAVQLQHALRETPTQANRVIAALSSFLGWCRRMKYRPLESSNPCSAIQKFTETGRKRYPTAEEYARIGKALRSAALTPMTKTAVELVLLTGARPGEIVSLQWSFVDLARGVLELPTSKTGAKTIPLGPAAVRILKKWPRFVGTTYVFPGSGRGKKKGLHLRGETVSAAWAELRETAKLDSDLRLYDSRHGWASRAISLHGLTLSAVGGQLGHKHQATSARYAHLIADVAQANAQLVGDGIAAALKRKVRA